MRVLVPVGVLGAGETDMWLMLKGEKRLANGFLGQSVNQVDFLRDVVGGSVIDIPAALKVPPHPPLEPFVLVVVAPRRLLEEKATPSRHMTFRMINKIREVDSECKHAIFARVRNPNLTLTYAALRSDSGSDS
jgi:hypothetical protein